MSKLDLIKQRDKAAETYYEGTPIMTDDAFDAITVQLTDIGIEQEVGHGYEPTGRKVTHEVAMLSLDKVHTLSQIDDWLVTTENSNLLVQYKYDGLAISIKYDVSGKLSSAVTRGNGIVGEDVVLAVKAMALNGHLPKRIDSSIAPIEIRGEIMITAFDFECMNRELVKDEYEPMTAMRNAAAGILRRHDTTDAGKFLSLFIYDYPESLTGAQMVDLGFTVAATDEIKGSLKAVSAEIDQIAAKRAELGYEIDGIVIKIANKSVRNLMGTSRTAPNWAIAYKFPNIAQETILRKVAWSTGRTGRIVPVATFDPIIVGGVTIAQATLHNYQYLQEMKLKLGDTISVTRSGEVIPYVIGRVGKHPENAKKYYVPLICPSCEEGILIKGKDIICSSGGACNVISSVVYSLTMLDVLGVSSALVGAIKASGKRIDNVLDLLAIKPKYIANLDRFGETSADKVIEALRVVWVAPLASWIAAIGIPNIGYSTARVLEEAYPSLLKLSQAKIDGLVQLQNVGWSKAEAIVNAESKILDWAYRLEEEFGFSPKPMVIEEPSNESVLTGKNIVLTGKLPSLTRQEAANYIVEHGGFIQNSVTKTTDILISGESVGSKMDRALSLGIEIITGNVFERIVL